MSDVFRKTTLGYEEITSRAHGLSPRLRRALIMIDGKRSLRQLMNLLAGETLSPIIQTLEIEGYIELIGAVDDAQAAPVSETQLARNMPSTTMHVSQMGGLFSDSQPLFIDSKGQLRKPLALAERKHRASRVVNELLGPNAEDISRKIDLAKDQTELERVLRTASAFITDALNPVAAARFRDHVRLTDAA
jgi:hypothetical protein